MSDQPSKARMLRDAVEEAPDDVPEPRRETPSSAVRRALSEMLPELVRAGAHAASSSKHPVLMHVARWVIGLLTVGGVGTATYYTIDTVPSPTQGSQSVPDCEPVMVQYALHLAETGKEYAKYLDQDGRPAEAEHVRAMTSPNTLPDDLRLCIVLAERQTRGLK